MFQVISLFGLSIPVTPLAALMAYLMGSALFELALVRMVPSEKRAPWRRAVSTTSTSAFVGGLAGARLAYALRNADSYLQSPQLLFSFRFDTLDIVSGLLVAGLIGWLFLRRACVPVSNIADAVSIGLAGALLILSLGDFLTGKNYGTQADIFWGVNLWGALRHPVQLYHAFAMGTILGVLWYLQPRLLIGELFWRFVLLYSLSQLILQTFHANAIVWGPGVRVFQTSALLALLVSMYVLSMYARRREQQVNFGENSQRAM